MPENFNTLNKRDALLAGSCLALFVGGGLYLAKLILEQVPDEVLGGVAVLGGAGIGLYGILHIGNSGSSK